tara:strand:+ start:1486 stop:1935 length:450 start_codon:yes stop_codon:yes gene_type:complete
MAKKSSSYQYKIVEIGFDQSKLNNFPADRGISNLLMENAVDERIADLKESLLDHLYEIINGDYLTEHQKKILFMRLMGKTQNEIAEHLGITQSAVHKAMHGNIDYKNQRKRYGGIIKKLKKITSSNPEISKILDQIGKINRGEEDPTTN